MLLYDLAAHWAQLAQATICTHLAETKDELQLLMHRDGPLRDFLISVGAWSEDWDPAGLEPDRYVLGQPSNAANWLIAHGNYLSDAEIDRLGKQAGGTGRRAVAYCPRTHHYFGHSPHPFAKMLEAGLVVCLGTDSLASTPSLSILDEMRFLRRRLPRLDGAMLLRMGTFHGAWALGRDKESGSLTPGKFADLAVIRLPDWEHSDPHDLLFDSDEPVLHTLIGGRVVFQRR